MTSGHEMEQVYSYNLEPAWVGEANEQPANISLQYDHLCLYPLPPFKGLQMCIIRYFLNA